MIADHPFPVWVFGVAALLSLLIIAMGFGTIRAFYLDSVRPRATLALVVAL